MNGNWWGGEANKRNKKKKETNKNTTSGDICKPFLSYLVAGNWVAGRHAPDDKPKKKEAKAKKKKILSASPRAPR